MTDVLFRRLVSDGLWSIVEPLIPRFRVRPQGGGTAPVDDRVVFTAIVYVLTSGCSWRQLPPSFGVDFRTAHRRFVQWSDVALWHRIHRAVLDELGAGGELDWSRAIVDSASVRAKKGGRRPARTRSIAASPAPRSMCSPTRMACRWS